MLVSWPRTLAPARVLFAPQGDSFSAAPESMPVFSTRQSKGVYWFGRLANDVKNMSKI